MTDQPMPFKVFGLQRTGTNLMVALMTRNFHVHSLERGAEWKHGPVQHPDRNWEGTMARFVLCVRNPYAWLHSCYRYFRRANGSDHTVAPQFTVDPSVPFDEFVLTPQYEFPTAVHRWNEMYRTWVAELPPERTAVVRQEDNLDDQCRVLRDVEGKLGVERLAPQLSPIEQRVDVGASIGGAMNHDYYLDREYMQEYSLALLEVVNGVLDAAQLAQFGYGQERCALSRREVRGMTLMVRPCTTDAAEVRATTFDPYGLAALANEGHCVRTYVDVGAGIGGAVLLARRFWPDCSVLAYDVCPENRRMLRINTRGLPGVAVAGPSAVEHDRSYPGVGMGGAITALSVDRRDAMKFEDAIAGLGQVDLLKIDGTRENHGLLLHATRRGGFRAVCRIHGRLSEDVDAEEIATLLRGTHRVYFHHTDKGHFFRASRDA